jgi:hypothetical protein
MSASSTPSCFLHRIDLLGNLFPITSLLDQLFLLLFLDHHTGHPARHDAQILLYEFIFDAQLNFFIIVSIYWKPSSYRSSLDLPLFGKTSNRSAAKSICFFLFDRRACYSTC